MKQLFEKLLTLNTLGNEIELSAKEAEQLGAFEETAISEDDAAEATEEVAE